MLNKLIHKSSFSSPHGAKAIISGCCNNNRKDQETLYRHFFPIMERMVRRYTDDQDEIIDILNDGFLRVFKKIGQFQHKGSFEGWIRRIIYHSISNYYRNGNKDMKFLIYKDDFEKEPSTAPNHSLYYEDLLALVDDLPDKHMNIFHLYAIEGLSSKEISVQLNINPNTCRWYLTEARKILQEKYSKKFLKSLNEAG